ncbi:alpha-ketoglutarate-dependent dioxygenase AlkB, partial [Rhodoferax sp.]|uniref:alpha-ketoglutarate-dependent dioxygenase AlkB n=1 Tax=Rhodoferax sp. TaxID=50421 RepID=UPI002631C8C8
MAVMDLFDDLPLLPEDVSVPIAPGAVLLRGFARAREVALWQAAQAVMAQAPLRHMQTPGSHTMSVAMTNCGALGWVSDPQGYRYSTHDPLSGQPWPAMPEC